MITEIGSRLRITNPSPDMVDWCKKHLEIPNPEYQKKARMNLWLGDTPRTLVMYEVDGDSVIIPFGCLRSILPLLEGDVKKLFTKQVKVDYKGAKVPLYDYQEEAVGAMIINHYGILQSPAGSGKTQIGIHHIFKRFYRSKNTSESQGIGLGLPLAKAIVEGQGGILSVQSERLQGTTFTLSFLTES